MALHTIALALRDLKFINVTKYDVGIEEEKDIQKGIEEIIDGLKCPKDFICYKSGFKKLCKVEDIEEIGDVGKLLMDCGTRSSRQMPFGHCSTAALFL